MSFKESIKSIYRVGAKAIKSVGLFLGELATKVKFQVGVGGGTPTFKINDMPLHRPYIEKKPKKT